MIVSCPCCKNATAVSVPEPGFRLLNYCRKCGFLLSVEQTVDGSVITGRPKGGEVARAAENFFNSMLPYEVARLLDEAENGKLQGLKVQPEPVELPLEFEINVRQKKLDKAVKQERYEDAARLRDEIEALKKELKQNLDLDAKPAKL